MTIPVVTIDTTKLSAGNLEALLAQYNDARLKLTAEARRITAELRTRSAAAKIKAELEKVPEEQRKAVLNALAG